MDMTCAGSFLMGGVSAVILMGLFILYMEKSPKKSKGAPHLRQIATTLLKLTEGKDSVESPRSGNVEEIEAMTNQPAKDHISPNLSPVDGRWSMEYNPFPGLP
jgi:hypothetical protein